MKERSDEEVTFSFNELRKLAGVKSFKMSNMEFAKHVVEVNRRLIIPELRIH